MINVGARTNKVSITKQHEGGIAIAVGGEGGALTSQDSRQRSRKARRGGGADVGEGDRLGDRTHAAIFLGINGVSACSYDLVAVAVAIGPHHRSACWYIADFDKLSVVVAKGGRGGVVNPGLGQGLALIDGDGIGLRVFSYSNDTSSSLALSLKNVERTALRKDK
jgi:hypothetical protein